MPKLLEWLKGALTVIASADKLYIAFAAIVYITSTLIYAARTYLVFRWSGMGKLSFIDAYTAYLVNILVNNITPSARAGGELVRAYMLQRVSGTRASNVINLIAFERVTEAVAVAVLAALALGYGLINDERSTLYLILVIGIILTGFLMLYHYWDRVLLFAERKLLKDNANEEDLLRGRVDLRQLMRNKSLLTMSTAVGFLMWLLDATRIYLIALAVGVHKPYAMFIAISLLYTVLGIVAVTPGGLGIVEGGLTAILTAMGIDPDNALAITLIERLISYGLGSLLGLMAVLATGGSKAWRRLGLRWYQTGSTQK